MIAERFIFKTKKKQRFHPQNKTCEFTKENLENIECFYFRTLYLFIWKENSNNTRRQVAITKRLNHHLIPSFSAEIRRIIPIDFHENIHTVFLNGSKPKHMRKKRKKRKSASDFLPTVIRCNIGYKQKYAQVLCCNVVYVQHGFFESNPFSFKMWFLRKGNFWPHFNAFRCQNSRTIYVNSI